METSFAVDWLSCTFKGITDKAIRKALLFGQKDDVWQPIKAMHGYSWAIQHPFGHIVMGHVARPIMGTHIMLPGQALAKLQAGGVDAMLLVKWAVEEGGKITRLDLAIDVRDQQIDIPMLRECPQVKTHPGSTKRWHLHEGDDGGATLYVGSRKSDKMMRIYDKAAQMDMTDCLWTRFELEVKRETSAKVAAALVSLPSGEIPHMVKGMMKGLFNPDISIYQRIMEAPAVHVPSTKDTSDNTLDWLFNSVAKTLAKQMKKHPDVAVWDVFVDSVQSNMDASPPAAWTE